ncbi:MAG: tail fiber domain-containing protein [Ignavibacteriae bacterium]|nr:tail fiber domain-containing protein [Ignavibacteriota bacterium]
MKKLATILMVLLFGGGLLAQNITNTLPSNGNFYIKDATNTFFTLQQNGGYVGIGSNTFDATNPEKLLIDCGTTSSVNAIYAKGTINSYLQFNIRNLSTGNQCSSDIVATANNGTETTNFMDIGINGSGYIYQNGNPIETGKANDCYILGSGNDLYFVNNNSAKDMIFLTGGTDSTKERMRMLANGNIVIGAKTTTWKFQVSVSSSVQGHVTSTGTWSNSSDVRLKKNINPIRNSLGYIMNLNPVRFDMKNEEDSKTGKHFGFIAQELEQYLPELVDTDNEGMKSVEYATLTSILTGAVKEQQVTIESQKKDIEQLKADIQELKAVKTVQSAGMNFGGLSTGFWVLLSFVAGSLAVVIIKKRSS